MRYNLNLARRPFVNTTVPAVLALLAAVGIVIFSIANVSVLTAASTGEAGDFEQQIERAMANLNRMQTQIDSTDQQLKSDEAKLLGDRIRYANELITRQKLNWTKLFDRLEAITPPNVRMLQISPYMTGNGMALLLRIEESEPEAALAFVEAMNASPYFGQVSLEDEAPSNDVSGQVWRLRVSYKNR